MRALHSDVNVILVENECLSYVFFYSTKYPKDSIKRIVLSHFLQEEINAAKVILWKTFPNVVGELHVRRALLSRSAHEAEIIDILDAAVLVDASHVCIYHFVSGNMDRMPQCAPEETNIFSLADRVGALERNLSRMQDQRNNDCLRNGSSECSQQPGLATGGRPNKPASAFADVVKQTTSNSSRPSMKPAGQASCACEDLPLIVDLLPEGTVTKPCCGPTAIKDTQCNETIDPPSRQSGNSAGNFNGQMAGNSDADGFQQVRRKKL